MSMLEKISWGDYWLAIAIMCAIYEMSVILLFFRKEFFQLALKIKSGNFKTNLSFNNSQTNLFSPSDTHTLINNTGEKENEILMPQVHELVQELKGFVQDVGERSFVKEEVIMGFQIILRDYKNLIGTNFQKSINDFIAVECEDKCAIHLDANEVNSVWLE
jgi:hypothetical protein